MNVPAVLTKQIIHECNIEKHEKMKKRFSLAKKRFFPAKTPFFPLNRLYFLRGVNHCPGRTKVTYVPAMGPWMSLDKPHSNSLALNESATKFCQINCVSVSMFYIMFL